MKSLSAIISIVVLSSSIILAEDSVDQGGAGVKGKQVQSDPAPILPMPNQARFEYKVLVLESSDSMEDALNELGRQGWELVTVTSVFIPGDGSLNRAYLKRILREPTPHLKN